MNISPLAWETIYKEEIIVKKTVTDAIKSPDIQSNTNAKVYIDGEHPTADACGAMCACPHGSKTGRTSTVLDTSNCRAT